MGDINSPRYVVVDRATGRATGWVNNADFDDSPAYAPRSSEPTKRGTWLVKFLAWFLGLTLLPGFGYFWSNGLQWDVCTGRWGQLVPEACTPDLDPVTDDQAEAYARRLVTHIDGGWSTDWVYDHYMKPGSVRTVDEDKRSFQDDVGRVDHMEYLGGLTRKGAGNTFTFKVLSWTTAAGYGFADTDRIQFHTNGEDEYNFTVYLTALSSNIDDVVSLLPEYERDPKHMFGTHDAAPFEFVTKGLYYDAADAAGGPRRHSAHGSLAAICYWVPPGVVKGSVITDTSKVMIRTYVGWVKYREIEFYAGEHVSADLNWPKDMAPCMTTQ